MLKHSKNRSNASACGVTILLVMMLTGVAAQAETGPGVVELRVKASLNTMVQEVHAAGTPAEKRAILNHFLAKVSRGTSVLEVMPFLSDKNHAAVDVVKERFDRYTEDLQGTPQAEAVADGDLDAFASYMQNDLEQAAGGIYLSTGAVIIVLLIILILL